MSEALEDLKSLDTLRDLSQRGIDEEGIIDHLERRVIELLDDNPELLFSWMYRLDVREERIQFVLKGPKTMDVSRALATLIWNRQKERLETREKYRDSEFTADLDDG